MSFTLHVVPICALQFADFLRLCLSPRTSRTISFSISIVFGINLIPFSIFPQYLLFFHPGCSGMCCFTWATARAQQLLFVALAAGLWCFTGGCHVKSPLFLQPPLKHRSVLHDGRKDKTVVFSQSNALHVTSYKFAAPRYWLPPMALQTVQVSVEPRLSTALKDRSVVP